MGASLAKDVPFAALYWMMLEPLRGELMRHDYTTLANSFWQNSAPRCGDPAVPVLCCLTCCFVLQYTVTMNVQMEHSPCDINDRCHCLQATSTSCR